MTLINHGNGWFTGFNSLAPGRSVCDFKNVAFNLALLIGIFKYSYDNIFLWWLQDVAWTNIDLSFKCVLRYSPSWKQFHNKCSWTFKLLHVLHLPGLNELSLFFLYTDSPYTTTPPSCWHIVGGGTYYFAGSHSDIIKHFNTWGPYLHEVTLISSWIHNHMPSTVWDVITYPFPNFNGASLEVLKGISNFIPQIIMDASAYPCWDSS